MQDRQAQPYDAVWGHYLFPAGVEAVWFGKLVNIPSTVSLRGNDIDREMFPPGDMARKVEMLAGSADTIVLKNAVDGEGQKYLLEALAAVRAKRPACLLLIGEVRPSALHALQLGLPGQPGAERAIVTGHLEQARAVADHLRLCYVHIPVKHVDNHGRGTHVAIGPNA